MFCCWFRFRGHWREVNSRPTINVLTLTEDEEEEEEEKETKSFFSFSPDEGRSLEDLFI